MKYCISLFCLIIAANAKAQSNFQADSLTLYHHNFNHNNTFSESQRAILAQQNSAITNPQQLNTDNSLLRLPASKLTYIANSKQFDIYQATPDNMFIVKPDDTIVFNMPVTGKAAK